MATALYNKYRPQIFEDVVGQDHIARTLKNAIASKKTSHSYLFTGPRGTGKTTTARLFSKALLCEAGPTPDPDGTCEDCLLIARGEHPDVYELDAASRTGVENVREEIIGKVQYAPTRGRVKVYIIDEVHMLSTAAFNALLKTLEEPPEHVVFILCTTDPQKIPETILSRCQRFDFKRISSEEMISRLGAICEMEGVHFEGDALDLIAHKAQGGMRNALTSLEQLIAFGDGAVTAELAERMLGSLDSSELAEIVDAIGKRDTARCFRWTAEYMETGADLVQFVQDLTQHMRDMYVMAIAGSDVALEVTESTRRELEVELSMFGPDRCARALDVLSSLGMELKTSTNQRLSFEVALTRLTRADSDLTLDALAERVESLERALAGQPSQVQIKENAPEVVKSAGPSCEKESEQPVNNSFEQTTENTAEKTGASEVVSDVDISDLGGNASRFWEHACKRLEKISPAYAVIFVGTSVSYDGQRLIIEFDSSKDFAYRAAQKTDVSQALVKVFAEIGQPTLKYTLVQRAGASVKEATPTVVDEIPESVSPQSEPAEDVSSAEPDFAEFLTSAFGENVIIEEVSE